MDPVTPAPKDCQAPSQTVHTGMTHFNVFCARTFGHTGSHRGMTELLDAKTGEWTTTVKMVWQ